MRRRFSAVFTYPASDFYDCPLVVLNASSSPSFVDVGINRISLTGGEERSFDIPRGASYRIGLGPRVRLVSQGLEVLKR